MPQQYKFRPNDPASKVLSGVTTGTSAAIAFNDCQSVNWIIEGSAGVGAGAVVIESSDDPSYSGTWIVVAGPTTVVASAKLGGKADFPQGGFVRARVSTTVTGGTVSVFLNGLQTF